MAGGSQTQHNDELNVKWQLRDQESTPEITKKRRREDKKKRIEVSQRHRSWKPMWTRQMEWRRGMGKGQRKSTKVGGGSKQEDFGVVKHAFVSLGIICTVSHIGCGWRVSDKQKSR